jgi:hypothetical protein
LHKIVANLHLNDGADAGEAIDHHRDQSTVTQPEKIRLIGRLWIIGWFLGNGDALEQRMGFLNRQDRRLAFLDRVAWAADGMAGLVSITWPVTSQSNSMRIAARCCLTEGGESSSCKS